MEGERARENTKQGHVIAWMVEKRYSLIVLLSLVATAWVFPYLLQAQEAATQLKLNSILDSLERTGEQNQALSQHYDVKREYKVFRRNDPKPISDVTAQVSFTSPDTKTFRITDAQGSSTGERIVSAVLEHEIASAKEGHEHDISRSNYDFVFLHEQNFGVVAEYVLHIIPKRNEKGLQNNRKPLRCQPIRVSGLTMTKASFQLHKRDQRIREKRAESFNRLGWTCLSS